MFVMDIKKLERLKKDGELKQQKLTEVVVENRKFVNKIKKLHMFPDSDYTKSSVDAVYSLIEDMLQHLEKNTEASNRIVTEMKNPYVMMSMGDLKYELYSDFEKIFDATVNDSLTMRNAFEPIIQAGWVTEQLLCDFQTLEVFLDENCLSCFRIYQIMNKYIESELSGLSFE